MNKLNIYGKLRITFGAQQLIVMYANDMEICLFSPKNLKFNYYGYCGRIVGDEGLA